MRLDKLLYAAGYLGRNHVKKLIRSRQVMIDGKPAHSPSQIVDTGLQEIFVAGKQVTGQARSYYLLYKPAGVVSARTDARHQTVIDLLDERDKTDGLYPVGRLDRDTEGLVLLTDNGPLGYRMLHPDYHVEKCYQVEVNGLLSEDAVAFFAAGIVFPDGTCCQPAKLRIEHVGTDKSYAQVTIAEGKFHQVKKMFLCYGVKVIYLKRVAFGGFVLDESLSCGSYRRLYLPEKAHLLTYFDEK